MDEFLKEVQNGQPLMAKDGTYFHAENPTVSDDGAHFTVLDETGKTFTEEDIDIEASRNLLAASEDDRIIFAKFHIPKDAKSVQAAVIYSKDDGKTWSDQIPAELSIAKPDSIPYFSMNSQPEAGMLRSFGHQLIENVWRDGFNTCLELFMTGTLSHINPNSTNEEVENNA
jgi:hypothetical protein